MAIAHAQQRNIAQHTAFNGVFDKEIAAFAALRERNGENHAVFLHSPNHFIAIRRGKAHAFFRKNVLFGLRRPHHQILVHVGG